MVRVCGLMAMISAVIGVGVVPDAGAQNPPADAPLAVKIGFPEPMFKDVPANLIQVAAKPFQAMLQKIANLNGTMEVVPDYKHLADRLSKGKIDIGVFHGFEYAWVKENTDLIPIVVTVPSCEKVQACLVVHTTSTAKASKDLKGACVAIPKGCKAHCQMFLDRERANLPQGDCCPANLAGLTPAEALDAVLNRQCDAALVDISAVLAYQNNAPGLGKQLKILESSKLLPSAVVVYRKGALTPQQVVAIRTGLLNATKSAEGQIFAMFWQLKGFGEVSNAYNKLLEDCLENYPPPVVLASMAAPGLVLAPAPRSKD